MKLPALVVPLAMFMSSISSANPAVDFLIDSGWRKGFVPRLYTDTGWFADKYKNVYDRRSYQLGRYTETWESEAGHVSTGFSMSVAKRHHFYYVEGRDLRREGIVSFASLDVRWKSDAMLSYIPGKGIQIRFKTEW